MSPLKIYLDEDVNVLLEELLRGNGHDVVSTRTANNLGMSDTDQLAYCVAEHRAIVTHNRGDFLALALAFFDHSRTHPGIIIAVRRPVFELSLRLDQLLKQHSAESLKGQLLYV